MTDERYKQLMEQWGTPNSPSLYVLLTQVVNEATQEERERCAIICEDAVQAPHLAIIGKAFANLIRGIK